MTSHADSLGCGTPQALKQLVEKLLLQGEQFSVSRYDLSAINDIRPHAPWTDVVSTR